MKDPEYLADARRLNIEVNLISSGTQYGLLAELYATPKEVLAKAAAAIARSVD
jgi:hypothetical protein